VSTSSTRSVHPTGTADHRPHLHIRPADGWVNDPNGIGRWDGRWHVFFQYNPDAPVHSAICWGHVSSADLLLWREEPVALRPRPGGIDAFGVWSGVATLDGDGEPVLVYTAVPDHAGNAGVALAHRAPDGSWTAQDVMVQPRPDDPTIRDVRDPFLFTADGHRYALLGGGRTDGVPLVLVYDVDDLERWRPLGELLTGTDRGADVAPAEIWECPQLVPLPDPTGETRWVLVLSLWHDRTLRGVSALVGDLDLSTGAPRFVVNTGGPLDLGPDFYAPQAFVHAEERRVLLWGWTWESRTQRTQDEVLAAGWAGALTFPRELGISGGRVVSTPARELVGLRRDVLDVANLAEGVPAAELPAWEVEAQGQVLVDLVGPDGEREVWRGPAAAARTRVLVDGSVVEAFADGAVWTVRAYPRAGESWRVRADTVLGAWVLSPPHQGVTDVP
jgi:beta-fructofuranosidase